MKIQLSPTTIVKDALTIWNQSGSDVDITMDLSKLTFKDNSIDALYSFHVLDHLFISEVNQTLRNWLKVLKPGGEMFIVVDDFEYICRSFVGGEVSIDQINVEFSHPTYFDRYNLAKMLQDVGIADGDLRVWFADVPNLFKKKHYELVIAVTKR